MLCFLLAGGRRVDGVNLDAVAAPARGLAKADGTKRTPCWHGPSRRADAAAVLDEEHTGPPEVSYRSPTSLKSRR